MSRPMRIRAKLEGKAADVKVLMSHPEDSGYVKDKSGKLIPPHFIQKVTATLNGKTVLDAQWGPAISENPYLAFQVEGAKAGDKVKVSWWDNHGETSTIEGTVS
jgi:sulfur-oxidizing protein SoxZ